MYKYARIIFRKNFLLWIPSIITVCLLSCLVSLCFMHFSWVSQTDFIKQATAYKLNLAEFKIFSATLYFVILTLSAVSLWLIGKATTKQLCPQFAQWRLLGATPRIKKMLVVLTKKQNLGFARVSVFATFDKIEKNNVALIVLTSAFTLLITIYLATKTLIVAVSQATGLTNFNLSDSFAIALLVALVALFTAFSIITLNFKNKRLELAILKSSGLTYAQSKRFVFIKLLCLQGAHLYYQQSPFLLYPLQERLVCF